MDRATEKSLAARAVELGKAADGVALAELIGLLDIPSAEVRRLAASAVGKLADLADSATAVGALALRLQDSHPQVKARLGETLREKLGPHVRLPAGDT